MKFELVEFYPIENKQFPKTVGTVHIYAIDCELDIRGILVTKQGKGIYFNLPHYNAKDQETGENVRYPHIRWTNQATHEEMLNFLHREVKPLVLESLKSREVKNDE
jgi:hypothetical protein